MNETLREKEELARIESESLRKAREDISHLKRKVDQHAELMAEKDRTAQVRPKADCLARTTTHRSAGSTRRDQHPATRVGPNRRKKSEPDPRQCQITAALA
jgi:hypothetical protein